MGAQTPPRFHAVKLRPDVIAHEDGAGHWPRESVFAFERGCALGVDVFEMGVHATSDGELMLIHNDTNGETTSGKGSVGSTTLSELRLLDGGVSSGLDEL